MSGDVEATRPESWVPALPGGAGLGSKVFNDPIHQHIELSAVSAAIIDTPQFQRLRDLTQLGGVYYVFPSAGHHRFEHCLGVGHLARFFVRSIAATQPERRISEADCLCVEIAGLCHDLGHGIMSHMFDRKFIPKACPGTSWEHEHASVAMLDHLLKVNELAPAFAAAGLSVQFVDTEAQWAAYRVEHSLPPDSPFPDSDTHFIKELIFGEPGEAPAGWVWRGSSHREQLTHSPCKQFLFEIVANKRNSIDVDKLDYFQRDCHQLNVAIPFDANRLFRFAKVVTAGDGVSTIGFAAKEAWNVYQLFASRYSLHKRAYQHRVARVIETMMTEALLLADPHIRVCGTGGTPLAISESIWDMAAYTQVSDYLLRVILHSNDPALQPARALLQRIERRDLYTFIAETLWTPSPESSSEALSPKDRSVEHTGASGGGGRGGAHSASGTGASVGSAASEDSSDAPIAVSAVSGHKRPRSASVDGGQAGHHATTTTTTTTAAVRGSGSSSLSAGAAGGDGAPLTRRRVIRERDGERIKSEVYAIAQKLGARGDQSDAIATALGTVRTPGSDLRAADLLVEVITINFGMGSSNPVNSVVFYHTDKVSGKLCVGPISSEQVSVFVPHVFEEQYVRLYCKDPSHAPLARSAFELWCAARKSGSPLPFSPARVEVNGQHTKRLRPEEVVGEALADMSDVASESLSADGVTAARTGGTRALFH